MAPSHRLTPATARRRRPPRTRAGFTLLEMMVALGLLALVLTLIYGSFFQISRGAAAVNELLTERQELRLLMKMITDDFQGARYLANFAAREGATSGIVAERDFVGTEVFTKISFHAALPARFHRKVEAWADPELHEVGYYAEVSENDPDQVNLVRREDFFLDDDMEDGGIKVVIAYDIAKFQVAFLAIPGTGGPETEDWEESWDSSRRPAASRMPVALRVVLARKRPDKEPLEETMDVNLLGTMGVGP